MPRGLIPFLLGCAVVALVTLLAREIRLHENSKVRAEAYARALAGCANGKPIQVGGTIVYCEAR